MSLDARDGAAPLHLRKCEPCKSRGGDPVRMTMEEIDQHMQMLCPSWKLDDGGHKISRTFNAKNFKGALAWLNEAGNLAEQEGHHPDLAITNWNQVTITLTTFSLGGLDINDFIVAAKSDLIPVDYSVKWLKENPGVKAGISTA